MNNELNQEEIATITFKKKAPEVPIWEKSLLTVKEAAAYFNIGQGKIISLTNYSAAKCALWIGSRRLIKRKAFEEFVLNSYDL